MPQYLLNATATWLLSLVLFDLFLRRESYHNYNRFYLLFTFLLGALLPLVHWQHEYKSVALQHPMQQVIAVKENIVNTTIPVAPIFNWEQLFMVIYLIGVAVTLCLLLLDAVKLVKYHHGRRSKKGNWQVIETGKDHTPFSFLNRLFVNNLALYDEDEWNMILNHEKRHLTLLHFADLMLMQLARIVLWFHPLVYVYNKCLLLVHEYQADKTLAQPQAYGKFLIEQAVLTSAPTLSHSFNRSPIKNRIVMLTHKSSVAAKSKMFICLPLALTCIFCFSKNSFSQKAVKQGNFLKLNGNTIEFAPQKPDYSDTVIDPQTGKQSITFHNWNDPPIKLNGKEIYVSGGEKDVMKPRIQSKDKSLADYMVRKLQSEFEKLADGEYNMIISNVVINSGGKVVYYENRGIQKIGADVDEKVTDKKPITDKIEELLADKSLMFRPAMYQGKQVDYLITNTIGYSGSGIKVKNHKLNWKNIEEQ